tara:strand:+ start:2583 stop:6242 length:3660 start_codon:yes stop_codon:yes gene_type:complete
MTQEARSAEEIFKSLGLSVSNAANKRAINSTPVTTYSGGKQKNIFDKDEEAEKGKLKKKDLYDYKNLNIIREYMTRSKGVDYEDAKDEKLVEDYVDHMRWFNTNSLSTAGEVVFVSRGDDLDKKAAKEAYDLYDSMSSLWTNDGVYGAIDGVKDYVFAAVSDPTNYIGALTGGAGKAAAVTWQAGGKKAIEAAVKAASNRAMLNGSTKKAARDAGEKAADSMAKKMLKYSATSKVTKEAVNAAAIEARRTLLTKAAAQAKKDVMKPIDKVGGLYGLLGTTSVDALVAMTQADSIQNLYLDVGAQENYSRAETLFSGILGGVGGAFHLTGRALKGSSGLGESMDEFDIKKFVNNHPHKKILDKISKLEERAEAAAKEFGEDSVEYKELQSKIGGLKFRTIKKPLLRPEAQKAAAKVIKKEFTDWAAKVDRGGRKLENLAVPESLLKRIMLGTGESGNEGLVGVFKAEGVNPKRGTRVSDMMTNVIKYMPQEDLQDLGKSLKEVIDLDLSDLENLDMTIGDVLAADISRAGSTLAVMSQVRRALHGGVVAGNDRLVADLASAEARELMKKEAAAAKTAKPFGYGQNVWKRLLVSAPQTTMANVQGFASYSILQSVADMVSFGTLGIASIATKDVKASAELMRKAHVYRKMQGQKMKNFMDANTTHDVYMRFLDENKDAHKLLFETVGNAAEASAKKYNIDPNNKLVYGKFGIENITNAASTITGVRIQDTFTKSQMFITEMDKYIQLKHKDKTLKSILESGDIGLIDDDVVGAAIDTTMRSVFSKDYTTNDQMLGKVAKTVESYSNIPILGTTLPFGRFMNNVVATTYQWGPLGLVSPAQAIIRKEKRNIETLEAFSRAAVGTGALGLAMSFSEEQEKKGLDYNLIEGVGGTIVDIKNAFPFSSMLATGRYFNRLRKGEATSENFTDMMEQLAIGQVAKDIQFANDLRNVGDYMSRSYGSGSDGSFMPNVKNDTIEALFKVTGNVAAGATRPLDAVNRAVGFVAGTDYARDLRQEEGGAIFAKSATKYVDNILAVLSDEVETVKGEQLRVASRTGELYDPNPLARMFGFTVKQGRTATEKTYSMAEMKAWTQDMRSKIPAYDKIFNQAIAPMLEPKMNMLLKSKEFLEADIKDRRLLVKKRVLQPTRATLRRYLDTRSDDVSGLERAKYKSTTGTSKVIIQKALALMRERGSDVNEVRDFSSWREVHTFDAYVRHLKRQYD